MPFLNLISIALAIQVFCNLFVHENKSSLETASISHTIFRQKVAFFIKGKLMTFCA
jgi:hypothetical protein